uniref:Dimethylargininase n=1 Tax=Steinernema glaseri TaxID=37863 RepID=A0A1I8A9P8_9BILA
MRFTDAIVIRIPPNVDYGDRKVKGKDKPDLLVARQQQEEFNDVLREAELNVIELAPEEVGCVYSLCIDDAAVVINGTALLTKPKHENPRLNEIMTVLKTLAWDVHDQKTVEYPKNAVLEGSDVLFTGKEIFVGLRKNGTNMEGASVLGRMFGDYPVVPVKIDGQRPLKSLVGLALDGVLTFSKEKDSQQVLKRMQHEATYTYEIIVLDNEEAVNCLNINDHLIFRQDTPEPKLQTIKQPTQLWGVNACELNKICPLLSQHVLLIKKLKGVKNIL